MLPVLIALAIVQDTSNVPANANESYQVSFTMPNAVRVIREDEAKTSGELPMRDRYNLSFDRVHRLVVMREGRRRNRRVAICKLYVPSGRARVHDYCAHSAIPVEIRPDDLSRMRLNEFIFRQISLAAKKDFPRLHQVVQTDAKTSVVDLLASPNDGRELLIYVELIPVANGKSSDEVPHDTEVGRADERVNRAVQTGAAAVLADTGSNGEVGQTQKHQKRGEAKPSRLPTAQESLLKRAKKKLRHYVSDDELDPSKESHFAFCEDGQLNPNDLWNLDAIAPIGSAYLEGEQVTDEVLFHFGRIGVRKYICIHSSRVSDRGLAYIASMDRLEKLVLADFPALSYTLYRGRLGTEDSPVFPLSTTPPLITPKGIRYLTRLENLQNVELKGRFVDDKILAVMPDFPNLTTLMVSSPNISMPGLRQLRDCDKLSKLAISHPTGSTEDYLRPLGRGWVTTYVAPDNSRYEFGQYESDVDRGKNEAKGCREARIQSQKCQVHRPRRSVALTCVGLKDPSGFVL